MVRTNIIWGLFLLTSGIILGAMGAHFFSSFLSEKRMASMDTAIDYQIYMGIALLALASLKGFFKEKTYVWASRLIIIGAVLFSFSIYGLVYLGHNEIQAGKSILGPLTPLGGSVMIIGWAWLLVQSVLHRREK